MPMSPELTAMIVLFSIFVAMPMIICLGALKKALARRKAERLKRKSAAAQAGTRRGCFGRKAKQRDEDEHPKSGIFACFSQACRIAEKSPREALRKLLLSACRLVSLRACRKTPADKTGEGANAKANAKANIEAKPSLLSEMKPLLIKGKAGASIKYKVRHTPAVQLVFCV